MEKSCLIRAALTPYELRCFRKAVSDLSHFGGVRSGVGSVVNPVEIYPGFVELAGISGACHGGPPLSDRSVTRSATGQPMRRARDMTARLASAESAACHRCVDDAVRILRNNFTTGLKVATEIRWSADRVETIPARHQTRPRTATSPQIECPLLRSARQNGAIGRIGGLRFCFTCFHFGCHLLLFRNRWSYFVNQNRNGTT